jgi:DNA repair protein RecN (Recombination protein N)
MVRKLSREERKQEIARMLGGVRVTQQTLAHAEEMLNSHLQDELEV